MQKVAIYARCSTSEQNVDLQLAELSEYAQLRRCTVYRCYSDEGKSGMLTSRPALTRLLADAHRRRFDSVLVWKLDRLGRSLSHLVRLVERFDALGVDLISLNDPGLDTTSPHGKLVFSVLGAVAEFERDLIRERTRAGIASARRRGKRIGRPRAYVPVESAERLLASGKNLSEVARELGVARTTLRRALGRKGP